MAHAGKGRATADGALRPPSPQPQGLGERAADRVARWGGSWTFVGLFMLTMLGWVLLNAWLGWRQGHSFDPYPYILLNLFLSMLAAVQAPIILMAQNRHTERDRQRAESDYAVNLKAELEIMRLHDKLDRLSQTQWQALMLLQAQQLAHLEALLARSQAAGPGSELH